MSDVEKNIGTHKPQFDGEWVRLEDVCAKGKSNLRQKDLKNDGPYPVYGAPGIVGFSSDYQNADAYVAVVKDGAGVGRVMACEPRSSVLGTMQALLPGKGTDRDYLLHLVRSMDLGKGFTGSTIPHIYFKDYGKTLVRALSRGRQVEVANRLSGIDRLISQGKQQLSALDDLVKSQFVEMFGDPCEPSPCSFPRVALKEVCELRTGPFGSALHKEDYVPGCHPLVNPSHVVDCQIVIDNNLTVDDDTYDSMKPYHLHIGDVVLGRRGEIGRCADVSGAAVWYWMHDCEAKWKRVQERLSAASILLPIVCLSIGTRGRRRNHEKLECQNCRECRYRHASSCPPAAVRRLRREGRQTGI